LIAHYPLNGTAETKDITPYANHGVNNGAVLSEGVDGGSEGSYSFDGVDDYIAIGNITPSTSDITLSMWINPNDLSGHSANVGLVSLSSTTQARIILTDDASPNTQVRWRHADGSYGTYTLTSVMTSGNWNFITMVYDSVAETLNGYLDGIKFIDNTSVDLYSNFNTINIGTASAYDNMDGQISNVKLYNRALSDDEVKMLYDMGREICFGFNGCFDLKNNVLLYNSCFNLRANNVNGQPWLATT
ncbi:LamG domain-containing protein, partial [Patescibacteria group bacterium]|nr:LamG domain-containing protein [Patescibacteria group bacterium]